MTLHLTLHSLIRVAAACCDWNGDGGSRKFPTQIKSAPSGGEPRLLRW